MELANRVDRRESRWFGYVERMYEIHVVKRMMTAEMSGDESRPSIAPGLGVCEWSPEGLYDKSVFLIPNTD